MAFPIIQSVGASSGAGVPGQGRNDFVPAERVDLSDTEAANVGKAYFWEFDDEPIGTSPTMIDHTTATPHFFVNGDTLLAGSYRVKCTVDGLESSVEILAKPLDTTGSRIPSFEEETQYDGGSNALGWHQAQTVFMRAVDAALGNVGSTTERNASMVAPIGSVTKTLRLGRVTYPGSLLAITAEIEESLTGGSIAIEAKIAGVVKLTTTLTPGTDGNESTAAAGTYLTVNGDLITIAVTVTGMTNASSTPAGLALGVTLSNDIVSTPITVANATNTVKGITKLSVAAAVPTEPVAVGTNDTRVPTQTENDALVGTSGTPSSGNPYVTDNDARNTNARTPTAHDFAGAEHNADTLADVNTKISDATLIDTGDSRLSDARTPTAHDFAGAEHNADTFANLNTKVSDETLAGLGTSQQFTKNQRSAVVALTDAATTLIEATDGNVFELTATPGVGATRQLDNPTGLVKGMAFVVIFNQDVSGARGLTYDTFYDWGDEGVPSFTLQAANISNIISCLALSATQIACTVLRGFA